MNKQPSARENMLKDSTQCSIRTKNKVCLTINQDTRTQQKVMNKIPLIRFLPMYRTCDFDINRYLRRMTNAERLYIR